LNTGFGGLTQNVGVSGQYSSTGTWNDPNNTPGCGTSFSQGVSLAPGASTTIDVGCSGGPGQGDTALLVMVDYTNVVAESDETNNVFSQPLT
jgi:hypothetical protein